MSRVIVITSGKGGVGKTSITLGIGRCLSAMGMKTLLVDTDMGLNNLDVLMNVEDKIVFDISDVAENRCRPRQALVGKRLSDGRNYRRSPACDYTFARFFRIRAYRLPRRYRAGLSPRRFGCERSNRRNHSARFGGKRRKQSNKHTGFLSHACKTYRKPRARRYGSGRRYGFARGYTVGARNTALRNSARKRRNKRSVHFRRTPQKRRQRKPGYADAVPQYSLRNRNRLRLHSGIPRNIRRNKARA